MFLIQFIFDGLKKGEFGIYINAKNVLAETRSTMQYMGFDPQPFEQSGQLVFIDLTPTDKREERVHYVEESFFADEHVIIPYIFSQTADQLTETFKSGRTVIDSYSAMVAGLATNPVVFMRDFNLIHSEYNITTMGTFDQIDQDLVEIARTYAACFVEMNCEGKDCLLSIKKMRYSPLKIDLRYKMTDCGIVITGEKRDWGGIE